MLDILGTFQEKIRGGELYANLHARYLRRISRKNQGGDYMRIYIKHRYLLEPTFQEKNGGGICDYRPKTLNHARYLRRISRKKSSWGMGIL